MQTRRNFLLELSLGAATVISKPELKRWFPDKKKLGVALIGLGNYATNRLFYSFIFYTFIASGQFTETL